MGEMIFTRAIPHPVSDTCIQSNAIQNLPSVWPMKDIADLEILFHSIISWTVLFLLYNILV